MRRMINWALLLLSVTTTTSAFALLPPDSGGASLPESDAPATGLEGLREPWTAFRLLNRQVVSGGVITGIIECVGCSELNVQVTDEELNFISGTVIDLSTELGELPSESAFGFVPDEELPPGSYFVSTTAGVLAVEIVERPAEELLPRVSLNSVLVNTPGGAAIACQQVAEGREGVGPHSPPSTNTVHVSIEVEGAFADQYAYRLDPRLVLTEKFNVEGVPQILIQAPLAASCVDVYATPLLGGEEILLTDECVELVGDATIGLLDDGLGERNATLRSCTQVSGALQAEWCDLFNDDIFFRDCEVEDRQACEAARETCFPEPEDEFDEEFFDSGGGCSLDGRQPAPWQPLAFLLVGAAWWRRRSSA